MYKIFLYLLLVLVSCVVISCKNRYFNLKNNQNIIVWKNHQERLSRVANYQVKGILVCSKLHEKKIYIKFLFQKIDHKYYRLVFNDFIGFTNIEVNFSENGQCPVNNFINNTKNCVSWKNFEFMIKKIIGINIPFYNFKEWILGLPGTAYNFNLNINGYLQTIYYQYHDDDFVVSYKSYFYKKTLIVPSIIEINCNSNYYFKIKICDWIVS